MDYPSPFRHGEQRHEHVGTRATKEELVMQHHGTPQHLITVPDEVSLSC